MDRVRGVRDGRGGVLDCSRGDAGNIILREVGKLWCAVYAGRF